ncbi:isochorismatase family protein [Paenibacillus sp. HB172176]|uniref:isochorismatase family protein n=1 Tax=Paenibacillus sp. HB172176 TaxID=2493690 RepID=UPI001439AE0F|nr:isochorismatase family protein [Paenibacillus sp. HB172176]
MALPTIQSYTIPTGDQLPDNRATWTLDSKRAVLLVHDMQQYFLNAFDQEQSPVPELLANIGELLRHCRKLGIPVIYTAQPGEQSPEQRGLLRDFWGEGINKAPHLKPIVTELAPETGDISLEKWRYSGFRRTNLSELMQERGRDQLIVTGIYAHIGCLMTACEAFMQDIQAFLIADAVADFSLDEHLMALNYAAKRCAVTMTAQQAIEQLGLWTAEASAFSVSRLREQVAALLDTEPRSLEDQDDLIEEHGLDSIRLMSLVETWRREGAESSFAELAERPTLKEWSELLGSRANAKSEWKVEVPNLDYDA